MLGNQPSFEKTFCSLVLHAYMFICLRVVWCVALQSPPGRDDSPWCYLITPECYVSRCNRTHQSALLTVLQLTIDPPAETIGVVCFLACKNFKFRLYMVLFSSRANPYGLTFTWCQRHKPTQSAHSFLFRSCVCFCLYGPFNCISFHNVPWQLSAFSLCSSGLMFALLVLSTIYLFMKVFFSPEIILCGWLSLKHQLTDYLNSRARIWDKFRQFIPRLRFFFFFLSGD